MTRPAAGLIAVIQQSLPDRRSNPNPCGWLDGWDVNPDAALDAAIAYAKEVGCFGMMFKDPEGCRDTATWYEGTGCRRLPPDRTIGQYLNWSGRITSAGLRVGGLIRHQTLVEDGNGPRQIWGSDPYATLRSAVSFTRELFDWSLYDVDSNWRSPGDNSKANLVDPAVFGHLARENPDCDFFPEGADARYADLPANVRPVQFFPNAPQTKGPPLVRIEPAYRVTKAAELSALRRAFAAGAWGLVSATWRHDAPDPDAHYGAAAIIRAYRAAQPKGT